jgi:tetratricopeptide (TPR) repeat protein
MAALSPGGTGEYQWGFEAIRTNRPAKAVEILEGMDPDRPDVARWRPYWSQLTQAYHMLGRYQEELEAVWRGLERFPGQAPLVYRELRALVGLGRLDEVMDGIGLLRSRSETRSRLLDLAQELRVHGHEDLAEDVLDEALAWHEAQSTDPERAEPLRGQRASALYLKGRLDEARSIYRELHRDYPGSFTYLGRLGTIAARLGDGEEASRISEQLAAMEGPYVWGLALAWQARIAAVLGDADEAVALLREAHEAGGSYGLWLHLDPDFALISGHPGFEELRRPKG